MDDEGWIVIFEVVGSDCFHGSRAGVGFTYVTPMNDSNERHLHLEGVSFEIWSLLAPYNRSGALCR